MVAEPEGWDGDIQASIAEYNEWYLQYTAESYRRARTAASALVDRTFTVTENLRNLTTRALWRNPDTIRALRMTGSPAWAVDRLIGITGTRPSLVRAMERNSTGQNTENGARPELQSIITAIRNNHDLELFPWIQAGRPPSRRELETARKVMTDRLAASIANPDIRNEQEARQLRSIQEWLHPRGYRETGDRPYDQLEPGTYRTHAPARGRTEAGNDVNVQVDVAIMPRTADPQDLPVLVECKSAGDFTNVNKRRKEESDKHANLVRAHPQQVRYILYLSGYFDTNYLQYEQDADIQWVWHHRPGDLERLEL